MVGALVLIATIVCVFMNTFESGLNEQIFFDERYAYEEKISSKTIECEIDRKSCLVSAIHKIEYPNEVQLRFRIAVIFPPKNASILRDFDFNLISAKGIDMTKKVIVSPGTIKGVECVTITIAMNRNEYASLAGDQLLMKVVFLNAIFADSYANCDICIPIQPD